VSDRVFQALFIGLLLVLPISALVARRVPRSTIIRYAAIWVVLFGVALIAVAALS
jgi:aspartyl protease family protein